MRKTYSAVSVLVIMMMLLAAVIPAAAASDGPRGTTPVKAKGGVYLVRMLEDPVVAYGGGIQGYKATKPTKGQKINPYATDVVKYAGYLDARHADALGKVGGARKLYDYRYSFNGFAAELTPDQAAKLAALPGVVSVEPDQLYKLDTASTPAFLGLDGAGGVWESLGGVGKAGEGVIVGMVDSGIWPEQASFSDRTRVGPNGQTGKLGFQQIPGWHGKCTPGEAFTASNCNQKLIGAQWFNAGWGGDAGVKVEFDYEFASARDADGHGTHTSSTAAGNNGVQAVVDGNNLGLISGMAPRARIATYKVCWGQGTDGGCFGADSVAAIDQAVADGVDVINFSISGSQTSFLDAVEVAFLFAADAGVFVAASAGNAGPTPSTVAHNSPWLTTVAAGTHDRVYQAIVTLGNAAVYTGASLGPGTAMLPVVLSTAAGLSGKDATEVRLCYLGTLDPAVVTGKIVVCDRGVNARVEKSQAVKDAGGLGMILANTAPNSLNADLHAVPTVHVDEIAGAAIKAYVTDNSGATAQLGQGGIISGAVAPLVATFSSRGPNLASIDILKPDIMAPGQDILAAVSPWGYGHKFDYLSGTSMSSPHIAGIAALFKQAHPGWSPAMIRSAMMTTASKITNLSLPIPGNYFAYGAGQVVPKKAMDPGLVYDAGWADWLGFLCGTRQLNASYCPSIAIDPSNLNQASIAIGDLAGSQVVKRTVTNVSGQVEKFTATVSVAGFEAVVTPASFTIQPNGIQDYTVTFTTTTAAPNVYAFGSLVWNGDKGHMVTSPVVLRPVSLAAPAQVFGNGAPLNYNVTFGYSGAFTAAARGLIPGALTSGTVLDDPTDNFVRGGPGQVAIPVTIAAGTTYARFSLFDDFTDGNDDLDLYVYRGVTLVGSSGSGTSAEEVNLLNPDAGDYTVYVHGWQTDGPDAQFTLFTWLLGSAAAGNMAVSAPAAAVIAANGTINLTFSGLAPATKYLGSVVYSGSTGMPTTIVRIDTP